MSGEVASREAQAAEVLETHQPTSPAEPLAGHCWCCQCLGCAETCADGFGDVTWGGSEHQAAMLAAAGLLAPPPPRAWTAGDPEPDDVRCVAQAGAVLWRPGDPSDQWAYGPQAWVPYGDPEGVGLQWSALLAEGSVTEVHLPTGAGQ